MRRLAAIAVLVAAGLVFGVGQLVLPGIAASSLRGRLARSGRVLSVRVSAFPAVELLWHRAGSVAVRMADYHSGVSDLTSLLDEAADVGTLHASIGVLRSGLLTLHGVTLSKRGAGLVGSGTVLDSDIRAALPIMQSVTLASATSDSVTLEGTASVLGVTATVPATVAPRAGRLVVVPDVPLVAGIATVTVFSDPHVAVLAVGGASVAGGVRVTVRGRLR